MDFESDQGQSVMRTASGHVAGVFKDSSMGAISYYRTETPSNKEVGSVMTVSFTVNGQRFLAMNAGPMFKFNEAISMMVECESQEEIDYYFKELSAVPECEQCGWCKDKYGLSWQVCPKDVDELLSKEDGSGKRAMECMLQMKKIDIAELHKAAKGE
jgi:predicted 3-demethylubiquinone-9 3-methyltransferase (glyoxalase superfamily)